MDIRGGEMKKTFTLGIISLLIFTLFIGCTTYLNLNLKQVNTFKKELMTSHKNIKKLKVRYSTPSLTFDYTLENSNEEEVFDIFHKTKELILDEDFQEDFFEKFFNTYFKEEKEIAEYHYPSMYINFDLNNDSKYEYQFHAQYYRCFRNEGVEGVKKEFDGYKTWIYLRVPEHTTKHVPE